MFGRSNCRKIYVKVPSKTDFIARSYDKKVIFKKKSEYLSLSGDMFWRRIVSLKKRVRSLYEKNMQTLKFQARCEYLHRICFWCQKVNSGKPSYNRPEKKLTEKLGDWTTIHTLPGGIGAMGDRKGAHAIGRKTWSILYGGGRMKICRVSYCVLLAHIETVIMFYSFFSQCETSGYLQNSADASRDGDGETASTFDRRMSQVCEVWNANAVAYVLGSGRMSSADSWRAVDPLLEKSWLTCRVKPLYTRTCCS